MPFAFSPSNMMTYKTCPRKFWGQSISKLIKWKGSKQKSRGTIVHEQVQGLLRNGWNGAVDFDDKIDKTYLQCEVAFAREMMARGAKLSIEAELAMSKQGGKVGWWDDTCFLRAKADAILVPTTPDNAIYIVDIKTGRNWDKDEVQLRTEAVLAHVLYKWPKVMYSYWYVDQGESEEGIIDFTQGITPVQDIFDLLNEMNLAIKNNHFPCQQNALCKWCDFYKTENCDA